MRILEFIHDEDHPEFTNIDIWIRENEGFESRKVFAYKGFLPPGFDSYDMILIHGGAQHIWNKESDPWLYDEIEYINQAINSGKPAIGFCLGGQIIAEILGGKVYEAREKEIGWFKVYLNNKHRDHLLLKGLEKGFDSFMWHSDHYLLPAHCIPLAYSEAAPYQIFVSRSFPAIGFQFHPEYTKSIIEYYFNACYEEYWKGGRYVAGKEEFLGQLGQIRDTYPLFKQLMDNAMEVLSKEFGFFRGQNIYER